MKIVEWIFPETSRRGGRSIYVEDVSEALSCKGYVVTKISDLSTNVDGEFSDSPFKSMFMGIFDSKEFVSDIPNLRSVRDVAQTLTELSPQIIHFHNTVHNSTFVLISAIENLVSKPKMICSIHDLESVENLHRSELKEKIIAATDYFLVPSKFILEKMNTSFPELANKTILIHLGINREKFRFINFERDLEKIVVAANLTSHKGTAVALAAMTMVRKKYPNASLDVFGDGGELGFLFDFAETLQLNDCVKFNGWIPREKLFEKFLEAGLFLSTSTVPEAFGLVVAEAQLAGVPVIASDIGAMSELVLDDLSGFLIPPGDISRLYDAIDLIFSNPEKHISMSNYARQRFSTVFDFASYIHDLEGLFKQAL